MDLVGGVLIAGEGRSLAQVQRPCFTNTNADHSEIQGIARQKIHPGKLDEFKHLAAECMRSAREKDTGTLQYDFYFNTDESECIVYERYRDSAALLEHTQNLGDLMGKVMAIDHHRRSAWRAQPGAGPRTGELWGAGVSAMAEALIRGSSIQV